MNIVSLYKLGFNLNGHINAFLHVNDVNDGSGDNGSAYSTGRIVKKKPGGAGGQNMKLTKKNGSKQRDCLKLHINLC